MTNSMLREEALRGRVEAIEELVRRFDTLEQEITAMRSVIAFAIMLEREFLYVSPGGCSGQARGCIGW